MKGAEIEQQMEEEYGINVDWLMEGCSHASPTNLVRKVESCWEKFTDEQRNHMSRAYTFPGGAFVLENEKSNNGTNQMIVEAKTSGQIICELAFKGYDKNLESYSGYLESNKTEMSTLDKALLREIIRDLEIKRELGIKGELEP